MSAEDRAEYEALVEEEKLLSLRVKIAEHRNNLRLLEKELNPLREVKDV